MSGMIITKRIHGPEFDGIDFAAPADRRKCYRLSMLGHREDEKAARDGGAVSLHWIDHAGEAHYCACLVFAAPRVMAIAEEDFARRMEAQGLTPGKMPQPGGVVYLARAIGEELGALLAACDCAQESTLVHVDPHRRSPTHAALWVEATPAWRRRLWHMVAPMGHVITVEQRHAVSVAAPERELDWMLKALRQHDAAGVPLVAPLEQFPGRRTQTAHELRRAHEQRTRREKEAKAREERKERAEARAKARSEAA